MNDVLHHNGYIGSANYSDQDGVFHGKLEGIRDTVTYEATDVAGLRRAFIDAVEDYLATCEQQGKEPEVPFKGSFNVRVGRVLHKRAAVLAAVESRTLNAVVTEALEQYLDSEESGCTEPGTLAIAGD